jgi:hypothetical protein
MLVRLGVCACVCREWSYDERVLPVPIAHCQPCAVVASVALRFFAPLRAACAASLRSKAELGSEGSIDGSQRLMLKGRFVPKKIESLLRKYILEYVTCEMCRSPDTLLNRDPVSRLFFVNCKSCNASRAVSSIRAGFQALKRGQRRKERVGR